jgi:hypothetical protein
MNQGETAMQFGSRMGKYFGSSGTESAPPHADPMDDYRRRAEDWVKRNPGAALAIGALAGLVIIRSPGLRKLALPLMMVAAKRMFTK